MTPEIFNTHSFPASEQFAAWRHWQGSVFDTAPRQTRNAGFPANSLTWRFGGFAVSRVSASAIYILRTKTLIRRNPVDHWVVTVTKRGKANLKTRDASLSPPVGVPFVVSLGDEIANDRSNYDQVQLFLGRDCFHAIAPLLDGARGTVLNTPPGRMLTDYMLLLERNIPNLTLDDGPRLSSAIQAMLGACLAPSVDRVTSAGRQIDLTLMERVRRTVRKHLHSPALGPAMLCREVATSRSQLYRLLEGEGGVMQYIQRRRLSESFAALCDTTDNLPIATIAETYGFFSASNFSRAFRREFGMSPSDVRASSLTRLAPTTKNPAGLGTRSFADCLRSF